MSVLDRGTRAYWRLAGRPVDVGGAEAWLRAPVHDAATVGDGWLAAAAASHGGTAVEPPVAGLFADLAELDGPGFRAADLRPEVRDFYERTSRWHLAARTRWTPAFRPAGGLVRLAFARRVQQLALPPGSPTAHGIDSRVVTFVDPAGTQLAAAWLRTLRPSGEYVASGCYSARPLPGSPQPRVHVAFPLQSGNVQVFLRPSARPDGSLLLASPPGRFGDDGAYIVVTDGTRHHAARIPIHETFHVHVGGDGVLRTDHVLRLWSATVVRLSYRLTPA